MRPTTTVLLCALAVGCSKRPAESEDRGETQVVTNPDPSRPSQKTTAVTNGYIIKMPKKIVGKKYAIRATRNETKTIVTKTMQQIDQEFGESEYVETIENDDKSKITRSYSIAQETDRDKKKRDLPYSGKTLTILRDGDIYKFFIGDRQLTPVEAGKLVSEFGSFKSNIGEDFFPSSPIKVGSRWEASEDSKRELCRSISGSDSDRSTWSGELKKTYTSKGRPWCVVDEKIVIRLKPRPDQPDKFERTATYEFPYDGLGKEGTDSSISTASWETTVVPHGKVKVTQEIESHYSVRPL